MLVSPEADPSMGGGGQESCRSHVQAYAWGGGSGAHPSKLLTNYGLAPIVLHESCRSHVQAYAWGGGWRWGGAIPLNEILDPLVLCPYRLFVFVFWFL